LSTSVRPFFTASRADSTSSCSHKSSDRGEKYLAEENDGSEGGKGGDGRLGFRDGCDTMGRGC
jgi:hypothetical protein